VAFQVGREDVEVAALEGVELGRRVAVDLGEGA
jgi:hypothetical protein